MNVFCNIIKFKETHSFHGRFFKIVVFKYYNIFSVTFPLWSSWFQFVMSGNFKFSENKMDYFDISCIQWRSKLKILIIIIFNVLEGGISYYIKLFKTNSLMWNIACCMR